MIDTSQILHIFGLKLDRENNIKESSNSINSDEIITLKRRNPGSCELLCLMDCLLLFCRLQITEP